MDLQVLFHLKTCLSFSSLALYNSGITPATTRPEYIHSTRTHIPLRPVKQPQLSTVLTFRGAAHGVVPEAAPPLLEVGTGRSSIPGGDRHLSAALSAAHATGGRARRPGTPGTHHTVDGCWWDAGGRQRSADGGRGPRELPQWKPPL